MTFLAPLRRLLARLRTADTPADSRTWPSARTPSGVWVTEDHALRLSAVWACVRLISETLASVPWRVYERQADGGRRLVEGTVDWLLHRQPNPEMTAFTFRQTLQAWALVWGNGYAEIERDGYGRPYWLWPIAPDRVTPKRGADGRGELYYEVRLVDGGTRQVDPRDIFHVKGLGYDGTMGYSVVRMAANSIGLGLATEEFGSRFFGNGASGGGVLRHPHKLDDKAYERLRKELDAERSGLANAHKVKILEAGMEWVPTSVPPDDAQFLETRKFQVAEICRWFRVPPHKVGDLDRATFSNIEHQAIEFVTDTLLPWVVPLEQEADIKLFGRNQQGRQFTKMNLNGLLRGDAKARAEFYRTLFDMGVLSPNDVRELEDLNPLGPEGGKRFVQVNLTTLERAGEEPEPAEPPLPAADDPEELDEEVLQ